MNIDELLSMIRGASSGNALQSVVPTTPSMNNALSRGISDLFSVIPEAQAEEVGTINGVKPGPSGPIRRGHPFLYTLRDGKIYDSANVAVSPESLEMQVKRLQEMMDRNAKNTAVPRMVEFANADLRYGIAATQKALEDYRKQYKK